MATAAPSLPTRFPCWCKAIYSWGGETRRDLGFLEGDLIECLNAGDGSWWMGRLKRDRRAVGLFPSNFVQVLPESFQPGSRNGSPNPGRSGGGFTGAIAPQPANPSAQKTKSVFRKPFQAYSAAGTPNPAAAARGAQQIGGSSPNLTPPGSSGPKHRPFSSMKRPSQEVRVPSPAPPPLQPTTISQLRAVSPVPSSRTGPPSLSRAHSPAPQAQYTAYSRAASPAPPSHPQSYSRAASPAPHAHYQFHTRPASPNPYAGYGASPSPPPPPPHRVAYNQSRAPSPQPYDSDGYHSGFHTPEPPPLERNYTPSPLTNAMNDVMSSLEGMSMSRRGSSAERPRTPLDPWSPEAFDQIYTASARKTRNKAALGLGVDSGYGTDDALQDEPYTDMSETGNQLQLHSYVDQMEDRLSQTRSMSPGQREGLDHLEDEAGPPPMPPPKNPMYQPRPHSSIGQTEVGSPRASDRALKNRKSAYELGRAVLDRTFTTKSTVTNATNTSSTTTTTNHSLMSGASAGAFSATSAGSLARRKWGFGGSMRGRPVSSMGMHETGSKITFGSSRPETPLKGATYHSSHDSQPGIATQRDWTGNTSEPPGTLGGLTSPKMKKGGFFRKMIESAKTGAASARSTISSNPSGRPSSPQKSMLPNGITAIAGGTSAPTQSVARDMGLGGAVDWVQVRRDINRSNSLSKNERMERAERCQMMDFTVINPIDVLYETAEGDEGLDGLPISEPTDFNACNFALVDKNVRFINSLPPMTNPASLAQGYVCRPYRSDVQRLRAIFTWVSERITWDEDFEGEVDSRRVIQTKHGCSEEIAVLVLEMCAAVGLHAEVIRGYLKAPGEILDLDMVARPNHWWNAVIVDGEWRIMDCSLANPTNPKRAAYSSAGSQVAESWWFLARPMEVCYTHVPLLPEQQHICPPLSHEVLMALPCACPPYFKNRLQIVDFDTSLCNLENLEMAHIHVEVPEDIECVAEVEARAFAQDADGDFFESGDTVRRRALAQADWVGGRKRYTIKVLLPGDEGQGVLKVYAGKRGLMHSIKSNPHPLSFALHLTHTGTNPPYTFLTLHPTPHAQRNDLYVAQPQCARLAANNTFVFSVRQHASSLSPSVSSPAPTRTSFSGGPLSPPARAASPAPFARPASAMSMASVSASGSACSASGSNVSGSSAGYAAGGVKPAKLAVQAPSGKIVRLVRKDELGRGGAAGAVGESDGSEWETIIKIGERGTWRGLVLADRSARWCVFAEWECV